MGEEIAKNCSIVKTDIEGFYAIYGTPLTDEHNCDQMGCPSVGKHFIGFCKLEAGK